MDSIIIRYGESVTLPFTTDNAEAVTADIFIGKPGEMYVLTQNIVLVDGTGTFIFTPAETSIPLDTYYYQINITDSDGYIQKIPAPTAACDDCDSDFPKFIVTEALDLIEVS